MDILEKIEKIRIMKGWSIYKLSNEACITQSTLTNMFARKTNPSIATLSAICDAFGITLSEFFSEDDDSNDETELLQLFRLLGKDDKKLVLELAKSLSQK